MRRVFVACSLAVVGTAAALASCVVETTPLTSSGGSSAGGSIGVGGVGGSGGSGGSSQLTASVSQSSSSSSSSGGTGGAPPVDGGRVCTPSEQLAAWAPMLKAPIQPPGKAALLDLLGPPALTEPAAEQILCQGKMLGDQFGDGTAVEAWGSSAEVWLDYAPLQASAGKVISLWAGYTGTLSATSRDGTHTYTIAIGSPIAKDGATFTVDWSVQASLQAAVNELSDAFAATFTPMATSVPDCFAATTCTAGTVGDVGSMTWKPFGLTLYVPSVTAAQPAPSTPNRLDLAAP